jgi:multicomponent K+:H+ antiporter subunit D
MPLGLLTLILGALGALSAASLRRQVAYLVVVSVGLLLTAFGLWTPAGIQAGLYYLVHSTFATAAFFLLADVIARGRGELGDRLNPGLAVPQAALVGGLFFLTALLVAGLPPLSGFLGKFLVLRAVLSDPSGGTLWAWVLGLVLTSSLLALVALARSGSVLFFSAETRVHAAGLGPDTRAQGLAPIAGLLALCVALTLGAEPVTRMAQATAEQLLAPRGYVESVLGSGSGAPTP